VPKFFQVEKAAYAGDKNEFSNVKFKKRALENSKAAEAGTVLEIIPLHVKNPPVIQFIAYLTSLSDQFQSTQTQQQPFGRPDPYYMWKSNNRTITVSFDIPSSSVTSGLDNLNSLSWFLAALYPTYKDTRSATSIAASPMFRVRFANLICSSTNDGQGLLGVIQSVTVTHDPTKGFIGGKVDNLGTSFSSEIASVIKAAGFDNAVREGKNILIPKLMRINFALNVVHDHRVGWDFATGDFRGGLSAPRFPYDFGLLRDTADTPLAGATISNDTMGENAAATAKPPGAPRPAIEGGDSASKAGDTPAALEVLNGD
jgi:hypothetical protein